MGFRTYKRHLTAADRRAKEIIAACAESGAGIEFLPDAPNFRFTPAENRETPPSWRHAPPSGRGSVPCGKNPLKLKNWSPAKLDANPMYRCPMKGDPPSLTSARRAWANGDPSVLRGWLAEHRPAAVQLSLAA